MGNLADVTWVFSQGGGAMTTRASFRHDGAGDFTLAELQDMAQAAYDKWDADGQALYGTGLILDHTECVAYDTAAISPVPANPPLYHKVPDLGPVVSVGPTLAGTNASPQAPPQVALVLSLYTTALTRSGRGRMYTPPPPEGIIDVAGELDAAATDALKALWVESIEEIEASIVPTTIEHVVVSLTQNVVRPVTLYRMGDRVDTQRRRLQRGLDTYR